MAASDADATLHVRTVRGGFGSAALYPFRFPGDDVNALRQAVALDAEAVHRDARWLQQVLAANLHRIHANLDGEFIELRFEGEANVDGAVSAHRAARRLVGEHAIPVIFNIGNVI